MRVEPASLWLTFNTSRQSGQVIVLVGIPGLVLARREDGDHDAIPIHSQVDRSHALCCQTLVSDARTRILNEWELPDIGVRGLGAGPCWAVAGGLVVARRLQRRVASQHSRCEAVCSLLATGKP